jgi:hypothetical protein
MSPRLLVAPALLLLVACPKAASRRVTGVSQINDAALWPVVEELASEAESLLKQQETLVWKSWIDGTPVNIGNTYEGKEELFSATSIRIINRLRHAQISAYQCSVPPHGAPPECPADPWGALEIRALTHLKVHFAGEHLSLALGDESDAVANLEASLTFASGGKEYHYRDLDRLLAAEKDAEKRQALYLGATRAVERLSALVRRRDERAESLVKQLGYPTYESFGEAIRYGNLEQLADLAERILNGTQSAYAKAMEYMAQRELHSPFEKLRRADLPRLLKPPNLQFFFPKDALLSRAQSTLSGLGIDLPAMKNVTVDLQELAYKNPRPLTVSVAIPEDIRLSMKPQGGARDQAALLHELGLAMQLAFMRDPDQLYPAGRQGRRPALRFELTRLGSGSVSQAYALLFEQLVEDPAWLQEFAQLSGDKLQAHLLTSRAHRLHQLRRRAGKLLYDIAVHRGQEQDAQSIYHRIMARAYGLSMGPEDDARYVVDRDELYQPADDLRAWLIAQQLQHSLKKRFGGSWWKNRLAGDFLRELWSKGTAPYPEELPKAIGQSASLDEILGTFALLFEDVPDDPRKAEASVSTAGGSSP